MSGGSKGKASLAVKEAMWKAWESKSPPVEWWRLGGLVDGLLAPPRTDNLEVTSRSVQA